MKNTLFLSLGVLLSAGTLLTACSNDDGASDDSPVGNTWTLTVKATKGGNEATTRALSLGGTGNKTLYATWAKGENVHVYSKDNNDYYLGALSPDVDAATANLMGGLRSDFADTYYSGLKNCELDLQFPQAGLIDYRGQIGTLDNISSKYDWATATVHIDEIDPTDRRIIPSYNSVTFVNQQAIVKFTLKDGDGNSLTPSSLRISAPGLIIYVDNKNDYTGEVIISPDGSTNVIWAALRGINGTVTLTATTVDKVTYTYTTKEPKTFENGKYYDITVKMTQQQ
jgi:hypothetical protein